MQFRPQHQSCRRICPRSKSPGVLVCFRCSSMLRQVFKDVLKAKIILLAYSEAIQPHSKNGFEALRLVAKEYMIRSRQEILHFRSSLLQQTVKSSSVMELVKHLEFEESRCQICCLSICHRMDSAYKPVTCPCFFSVLYQFRSVNTSRRMQVPIFYDDLKIAARKHEAGQRLWAEIGGNAHSKYLHGRR